MPEYTLKCFVESGNAYKVALMLQMCEADWQAEWVDFFNGETRTSTYRDTNVMGEVPLLVDHKENDLVLSQSGAILLHLADKFGKFVPAHQNDRLEMMRWMFFDNHKLTSYVATFRFLSRFSKNPDAALIEFFRARALAAIKILQAHLSENDWVLGEATSLADISMCGYLFWPDHIGIAWSDYPAIAAWLERIQNLPHWAAPEVLLPAGPAN